MTACRTSSYAARVCPFGMISETLREHCVRLGARWRGFGRVLRPPADHHTSTHSRLWSVLDAAFATVLILAVLAPGTAGIYALSRLLRRDGTGDGAEPIET